MKHPVRIAIGLWILLALVVFSVKFDWETRLAAHGFVQSQLARQQAGQPPISINDGFTPMVRNAARQSAVWFAAITVVGVVASAAAGKQAK